MDKASEVLQKIYEDFSRSASIKRKMPISRVTSVLEPVSGQRPGLQTLGDDAAPLPYGEGYLLLAADGISPALFSDPFWAGYCSVLVNVNDIYAMGGRPLAMVDVISAPEGDLLDELVKGIKYGCEKFGVPMVGGHLHPGETCPSLIVSIMGEARVLVTSFCAREGDSLVLAVDLEGCWHDPFPHWDSTSGQQEREVRAKLALLPGLAERGLLRAGKDVSNPGILGTAGMLLESSEVGAVISLEDMPRPAGVALPAWLKAYPGFGFLLSVAPGDAGIVLDAFQRVNVAAGVIGEITGDRRLVIEYAGSQQELIDLSRQPITGIEKHRQLEKGGMVWT